MLKTLLVEDNYEYLESLFNNLGNKLNDQIKIVKICNDGEKALKYIINENLDIILLDLNIPKINGLEILQKIKDNNIDTNVIVITGETNFLIELTNRNLPVRKTLFKPFKIDTLIDTLNDIIYEKVRNINQTTDKLVSILNNFNLNKSSLGYKYIIECLNICIENEYTFIPKINQLYQKMADNNISDEIINWNVSKTIQAMNKSTDTLILERFFPYNKFPSPKIFLNEILACYYKLNNY